MSNAIDSKTSATKVMLDVNKEHGSAIYTAQFQKAGTLSVQLRQEVTKTDLYNGKRSTNEMNGGLFGNSEFGASFQPKAYDNKSARVAWINVPVGTTIEEVQKRLDDANANGACIYRVLSNRPIITDDQRYSIKIGQKTEDSYADQQVMRYPEGSTNGVPGTLILHEGKVQYRKTFFWPTAKKDEDFRGTVEEYRSVAIEAELTGAKTFSGQKIDD